jgi:hypothetical protein
LNWASWTNPSAVARENGEEKPSNPLPKLTETEQHLFLHIEDRYQLETDSLGDNPILRHLKGNRKRPSSANRNTIKTLEQRGLITPGKGHDPLTILWRLKKDSRLSNCGRSGIISCVFVSAGWLNAGISTKESES